MRAVSQTSSEFAPGSGRDEREPAAYDVAAVQEKWRPVWERLDPFRPADDGSRERRYALTMFPYPSGDLHMGHAEVFALHDVLARSWWQRGYDVLNPIGWDSFGLPAENAAIKRDEHPATYTYANIETQAESIRRYAVSFDWSRRLHTSDPDYYRWTQWLFLRFRERGLAYRKLSPVNWCPVDQTVLANEQVVQGACERCGAEVTKRELSQWYFKITDYAQRLLDDMEQLEGRWPDRVLAMQRNWIGRSEGAHVDFDIELAGDRVGETERVTVFTTRPDTLYGATFMVVAADAKLAERICAPEQRDALAAYVEEVRKAATSTGSPPSGPRAASTSASSPSTRSTASGCRCGPATTCWPTTARARSWRCPPTTSATWTSPARSTCRCGASSTRARRTRRPPASRPPATGRTSTPGRSTAWPTRRPPSRGSSSSSRPTAAAPAR